MGSDVMCWFVMGFLNLGFVNGFGFCYYGFG